ncbi:MAG: hypothetical protein LKJ47_00830 [Bifidobacteriaceae bacterium]|nr:hypothetical protein [Bifidobacteriaceae bacterium]
MTLCAILASLPLLGVYESFAVWTRGALPSACLGTIVGTVITGSKTLQPRHRKPSSESSLRFLLSALLFLTSQCVIGPVVALPSTTVAGIIPTAATVVRGVTATVTSFASVITLPTPLSSTDGSLMALWTLTLLCATAASACATATTQSAASAHSHASVSILVLQACIGAFLGTHEGFPFHVAGTFLGLGLLTLLCLLPRTTATQTMTGHRFVVSTEGMRQEIARRSIKAMAVLLIAAVGALLMSTLTSAHRVLARDIYQPPLRVLHSTSPLSRLRSYVAEHKTDDLLTVTAAPENKPIRLAALNSFDGVVWSLSSANSYRQVANVLPPANSHPISTAVPFSTTFTVSPLLDPFWLPTAGTPESITLEGGSDRTPTASASTSVYFDSTTTTLFRNDEHAIDEPFTYTLAGKTHSPPSEKDLANAIPLQRNNSDDIEEVVSPDGARHSALPSIVATLAASWLASPQAAPSSTDLSSSITPLSVNTPLSARSSLRGKDLLHLAQHLSSTGWFSHGLGNEYPSLPGHSSSRIAAFLESSVMVGDSEQYASALALMARGLGCKSRVVIGFRVKKPITSTRPRTTTFTGNDIEAWVEIPFEKYGWVSFFPTPPSSKTPDKNTAPAESKPQTLVRQPPPPLATPLRDIVTPPNSSLNGAREANTLPIHPAWPQHFAAAAHDVFVYGSPLWCALILVACILSFKRLKRWQWETRGTPSRRIENGWTYLTRSLLWHGIHNGIAPRGASPPGMPPCRTRREYARSISASLHHRDHGHSGLRARQFHHSSVLATSVLTTSVLTTALISAQILEACNRADAAFFSRTPPSSTDAAEYWKLLRSLDALMSIGQTPRHRWRAALSLSGIFDFPRLSKSSPRKTTPAA